MKAIVCAALLGTAATASADVFAFKDLDGYESCLRTDHVVETVKTSKGSQSRLLLPTEIQERCAEAGTQLLAGLKNKDLTLQFIQSTKRLSWPENSLDQIGVFVDLDVKGCNEIAVYEVLLKALGAPAEHNANYTKVKPIVKRCLKDAAFKKDFLEEKDNADSQISANACGILLEEKLVMSCKGTK